LVLLLGRVVEVDILMNQFLLRHKQRMQRAHRQMNSFWSGYLDFYSVF